MKYARTMDDDFPIAYEMDKPSFDAPIMFFDGTTARLQDNDIVCLGHPRCPSFKMRRQHIIKEADSIEKLCDCFAVEDCLDPVGKLTPIRSFAYAKRKANEPHKLLYGYIIAERKGAKALEPVAVLNEKGEMELL